ncbi:putative motility protein [Clostridium aminobutyricum]|uniref:Motility protein n=1 Tax=Clostridium aminobutyricum TaxID=33953 RepID=A0A939II03_CLOAM|nr:putative motility protein [Clostridium aminobutyricum]MBN7772078.1 putative motility protein [Clostridium aminobutyricum]
MDVTLSSFMAPNLQSLQQTLSMSVTKMAMNSQTTVASEMISDFTQAEAASTASVPAGELGHHLDVYA